MSTAMNTSNPSALPPATKLFLDALQAGGKLTSPTGPTVLAQAGAQMGLNPQQDVPAEAPPEEQQGIAAILNQAQQAGPTIANNQAMMQQQQLVDQAANKAAPAAAQMLQQQPQPQQPQGMAHGGLAAIPSRIQEFKEGGVIGYEEGGPINKTQFMGPQPEEATSYLGRLYNELFTTDPEEKRRNLIANQLRRGIGQIPVGLTESLTPTERASRLSQESQLRGMLHAIQGSTTPDTSEAAARAMIAPVEPVVPETQAAPAKTAPKADAGSSRTSVSTREKIGGPTAPEQSGIAAGIPTVGNVDDSEAQRLYKLRQTQIANKPDFQSMGLADIAAMQKRDEDSASFRRYAAIAGARRPGINAGSSMMAAAGQFTQAQDALANAADAAKTALAKATYAESIGDTDAMLRFQKEFNDNKVKMVEIRQKMDLGIYEQQQANKRNEAVNAVRAQMAEMRASMGGAKGNLKDPNYVANMISDNVTNQMKDMIQVPQIGMGLKNLNDYSALRDQLMEAEIAKFRARGADVSMVSRPASTGVPPVGEVRQGYKFKGGNPADKANWEKV
jgi:hypothetical protein